jgi:hypothetical protein
MPRVEDKPKVAPECHGVEVWWESIGRLWALDQIDTDIDGILFIPKRPCKGGRSRFSAGLHQADGM